QSRFGGDAHLVGQTLPINGASFLVVGILPRGFWFSDDTAQIYTLLGQWMPLLLHNRGNHPGMRALARLKPGVSLAEAKADMNGVALQLSARYPKDDGGRGIDARPMKQNLVEDAQSSLWMLLGAVGLVLFIACANVANLLLARGAARRRELALRTALGAGQNRIVRQLLTESVVLGVAGGVLGLGLAALAVAAAPSLIPGDLPRLGQIKLDGLVLGFTLGISLLGGLLFGLAPALQSRRADLFGTLKEGGRAATGASHRTQNALVIGELALALMLLAGAALLIQSLGRLLQVDPGFEPHHAVTMQFALSPSIMSNNEAIASALDTLEERVQAVPGVVAAAETTQVPLSGNDSESGFWKVGEPQPSADHMPSAMQTFAGPGWIQAMGIPLVRGRFFNRNDNRSHLNVVVIDTVMAHDVFPGQDPIGRALNMVFMGQVTVIGVVGHVRTWGLGRDDTATIRDQMYMPIDQVPMQFMTAGAQGISLVVRAAGDPMTVMPGVRAAVAGAGNDQPVYGVKTMDAMIASSLSAQRFIMTLLGGFALLAVVLAGIGVYGVLAYTVEQRRQEVGIRMALGAAPGRVRGMMLGHGLRLGIIGAAIGLGGAMLTTRTLAGELYGVKPNDPLTLIGVTVLLLGLAALASFVPAARAARVDPMLALRDGN
ncbi:MAG TPA: ADOP family duplicated permease, partial [Terriglobales bacterium]